MPACMGCKSAKQFSGREDDDIGCRETKAARECSLDKIDALDRASHDFAKALDFALRLKIDDDSRVVCAPFFQAIEKLRPFSLCQHEIAGCKLSHLAILECAAEIFRTSFNPAFADLDVRVRLYFRLDFDLEMIWSDVIANEPALAIRCFKQNIGRP